MKRIIVAVFILSISLFSQQLSQTQLDSIYTRFVSERGMGNAPGVIPGIESTAENDSIKIKCGFGINSQVRFLFNQFTPLQQIELSKILQRPSSDTSIVSPKGYFRIHFYKSGGNAPSYDVNLAAIAADSAWDFEINYLGYPAPPSDNGAGGDNKYDIYISNLGNIYGQTTPEDEISANSNLYDSYLEVDNDFSGFYTTGIDAFRVTVAHEFHHAIQIGNYTFKQDTQGNILDQYFYELTSTSMEIFVYNSIHDYVGYLSSYFNYPGKGFSLHEGYDLAIWNLFLKMNFGYNIIKRQWQLFVNTSALNAINTSLVESGANFGKEYSEFGIWSYYTNYRSDPVKYFGSISEKYPLIRNVAKLNFSPPSDTVQVYNSNAASNSYISFANGADTLMTVMTNSDYQTGIDNPTAIFPFKYILFNDPNYGERKLSAQYSADFIVDNPSNWLGSEILNGTVVKTDSNYSQATPTELSFAYPQPFYYKQGANLRIPVPAKNNGTVELSIYSISMVLVYSNTFNSGIENGHSVVFWNGRSNRNEKLASGVYIYFTKSGDEILKGKLVIFNE